MRGRTRVKISILYPNSGKFDMDYYLNIHMLRSIKLLSKGNGYRGVSVERGLGGASPGSAPTHVAMCHYLFDTSDDFMAAFLFHAAELQGDMQNDTGIESVRYSSPDKDGDLDWLPGSDDSPHYEDYGYRAFMDACGHAGDRAQYLRVGVVVRCMAISRQVCVGVEQPLFRSAETVSGWRIGTSASPAELAIRLE